MPNNNISSALDAKVIDVMTRRVSAIAEKAKGNVRSNNIPSNIADAISVTRVEKSSEGYKIQIRVDVTNKAPSAAAYEYGSGLHGKKRQKYPIDAKNKPNLVFFWEREGRLFIGPHVDHPGVAARPYLKPAVDSGIEDFRKALAKSFKDAVLSTTTRIEVIRAT